MRKLRQKVLIGLVFLLILIPMILAATRTFHVQETDFVKIVPKAIDLDYDAVVFNFSEPLDEKGEWQTTYDDEGEYEIEILASDGKDTSKEKVRLIVSNKNQPPVIKEKLLMMKESQVVDLREIVDDPDGDVLKFEFKEPFNQEGRLNTTYDDEGLHLAEFTVSDGEFTVPARVEITVLDTNKPPMIKDAFSLDSIVPIKEGETLKFFVEALDEDLLQYEWLFDGVKIAEVEKGEIYFDFNTSGKHFLELNVSDPFHTTLKQWNVEVKNVNRRPALTLIPVTVNEGEEVVLDLPRKDADGDELNYIFQKPFNDAGRWLKTYNDAGTYNLTVKASDGELEIKDIFEVMVSDVDRVPTLEVPGKLVANEGEKISFIILAQDPDNDSLNISVYNMPAEARLDSKNKTFIWTPSFDTIKRKENILTNILNALRLERFFLEKDALNLRVEACGKKLCTERKVELIVHNVNRRPVFNIVENFTVRETETVSLSGVRIDDADNDLVRLTFTSPLGKRSGKWRTTYNDAGVYTSYLTASDGQLSETKPVVIQVQNVDRPPSLKVSDEKLLVNEGEEFVIKVTASDIDNTTVNLTVANLLPGASFREGIFSWTPPFDFVENKSAGIVARILRELPSFNRWFSQDEASLWIEFIASYADFNVIHPVKITVKDVNRKPQFQSLTPARIINTQINEPDLFQVEVADLDQDALSYRWIFGVGEPRIKGTKAVERVFVTPGTKKVSVIVSDGLDSVRTTWTVNVLPEEAGKDVSLGPPVFDVYVVEG